MSCEICGRGNCTSSFHSLEEQDAFDEIAGKVKERIVRRALGALDGLDWNTYNRDTIIRLGDAKEAIEELI